MPRVKINAKKYALQDMSSYILGEMKVKKIKQSDMAIELGTTQQNLSKKLHNNSLTHGDLLTIFKVLETPDDKIIRLMRI